MTTITASGKHRKTVYFSAEEWDAIRTHAFKNQRQYTDVVRQAVRRMLRLPEP